IVRSSSAKETEMEIRLDRKAAIVTGSTVSNSNIGYALARLISAVPPGRCAREQRRHAGGETVLRAHRRGLGPPDPTAPPRRRSSLPSLRAGYARKGAGDASSSPRARPLEFISAEMAHYGATKAALLGLSRGLAENVAGAGVTVNCFVPGPT